jgi:hypothetical protein
LFCIYWTGLTMASETALSSNQSFGDLLQDLKDILAAHHIEKYNRNQPSLLSSPQLSHISEEMLSQPAIDVHTNPQREISNFSGSLVFPSISNSNGKLLNIQGVKEGTEVATRYSESVPVVSYCSKGGERNYESLGQRKKHIVACSTGITPTIHISRIDRIENSILKHKRLGCGMKSAQTCSIKVGLESFSPARQTVDMNSNNSISRTTEQCEIERTSSNKEPKTVNLEPRRIISSLTQDITPKVVEEIIVRKDIDEEECHKTKVRNEDCILKGDSANSAYKLKPTSKIVKSDGVESSQNNFKINSDSTKGVVVSKTAHQRPKKLSRIPQRLNGGSAESGRDFKEVECVMKTGVSFHEKSKEIFHEPEEPAAASSQCNAEFEKDKNKKITMRSDSESSSLCREGKSMGTTEMVFLHRAKNVSDISPEPTKASDLQKNVQNSSKIFEMKQEAVSAVKFKRLCNGKHDLGDRKASVSKNILLHISDSEGELGHDTNGNTSDKSETSLHKYEKQDECVVRKTLTQNDYNIEEIKHRTKSNTTSTGESHKLRKEHTKASASKTVSISALEFQKAAARSISTEKAKNLLHKPHEEAETSHLKHDTHRSSSSSVGTQAVSSRKLIGAPEKHCNEPQVEVPVSENCVESNTTAKCRNISEVELRLHEKPQEETGKGILNKGDLVKSIAVRSKKVTWKSQEQIYFQKTNVHHDSDSVESTKRPNTRSRTKENVQLNYWQKEKLRDHAGNPDSEPQATVNKVELYNRPEKLSEGLKKNVQNESEIVEQKKAINSSKEMEKSTGLYKKQQKVLGNCTMINCDSLIGPITDSSKGQFQNCKEEQIKSLKKNARNKPDLIEGRKKTLSEEGIRRSERLLAMQRGGAAHSSVNISDSVAKSMAGRSTELGQKPVQEVEVSNSDHSITSITLSHCPKTLIHEGEEKIDSFNSEMLCPFQNKQQACTKIAIANRLENSHHMLSEITADAMLNNNQASGEVACMNRTLDDRFKGTENVAIGSGNTSELHRGQQMNGDRNATTDKVNQVLQESQRPVFPGGGKEGRTDGDEGGTVFSTVVGKSLGRTLSKSHTSSDSYTEERHDRINDKDSIVTDILRNDESFHRAQKQGGSEDRRLRSFSDTFYGSDKQKYMTSSLKGNCFMNSDFIFSKSCAKVPRSVSGMKSDETTKKDIQEHSIINHSRLSPSKLQQLISEWDSDTERVRSDEFLQDDQLSYKDMMPNDMGKITHPPVITLQQHLEEKGINEADNKHKKLLLGEDSSTKGKNPDLAVNEELNKRSKSSLPSHTITMKLQDVAGNTPTSRNEDLVMSRNLKAKYSLNASSTQKLNPEMNAKSPSQLSSNKDNMKNMQGLSVTKIVPSPETPAEQLKTQGTSNDSIKTPSRKRRLHSMPEGPEFIELKDFEDRSWISTPSIPYPCRRAKRRILEHRNKTEKIGTVIKKLEGEKRGRKKEERGSASTERDRPGVTVSNFGGLPRTPELNVSTSSQFSMKNFSGRWRNKYLEEVTKRRGEKKCRKIVERPVYSSVYSDIETDSDSVISWLEPAEQKLLKVFQKPKRTYEKKGRKMFPNKNERKGKKMFPNKNERKGRKMFPNKKEKKQLMMSNMETDGGSACSWLERGKRKVSTINQESKMINGKENQMNYTDVQRKGLSLCSKQHKKQFSLLATEKSVLTPETGRKEFHKQTAENHVSVGRECCMDESVRTFATHAVENRHSYIDMFRGEDNEQMEEAVPIEINILPCLKDPTTFRNRHLSSLNTEAEHTSGNKIAPVSDEELLNGKGVKNKKMRIPLLKKKVGDKMKRNLQDGFNLCSASGDIVANISKISASVDTSSSTCGRKLIDEDLINDDCNSNKKSEVADDTSGRKIQTDVTCKESKKYVCNPRHGGPRRDTDYTENTYIERTCFHLSGKITEIRSDQDGTRCNQSVASIFHSAANAHANFAVDYRDKVADSMHKDICQGSPQRNIGYCSGQSLLACEHEFEEETSLCDNQERSSMNAVKHVLEDKKRGMVVAHGRKTDKFVANASLPLGRTGKCDAEDCDEDGEMLSDPRSITEPEQPCVSSLPSSSLRHAPPGAVSNLALTVGERQSLSPQTGLSYCERGKKFLSKISKKDKHPVRSDVGSSYSGKSKESQAQITESFSKKNEPSVNSHINSAYSERSNKPIHQRKLLLSKKNEQLKSPTIGLSCSKTVHKPISPYARDTAPLADVTCRQSSQQDIIDAPQKSMPFILESAAEDKCVQSSRRVLRSDKKSRYSSEEESGCTIVAKERKKPRQTTDMAMAPDGRTMAVRELPKANGK